MTSFIATMAVPFLFIAAAVSDALTFRIPNLIPGLLVLLYAVVAIAVPLPLEAILIHLGVFAATLVLGMALFAFNLIGGGDAKFFAACGLWVGLSGLGGFLLSFSIAGGALAIALLALRRLPMPAAAARAPWAMRLWSPKAGVPYGVALGAGALFIHSKTALFAALTTL